MLLCIKSKHWETCRKYNLIKLHPNTFDIEIKNDFAERFVMEKPKPYGKLWNKNNSDNCFCD